MRNINNTNIFDQEEQFYKEFDIDINKVIIEQKDLLKALYQNFYNLSIKESDETSSITISAEGDILGEIYYSTSYKYYIIEKIIIHHPSMFLYIAVVDCPIRKMEFKDILGLRGSYVDRLLDLDENKFDKSTYKFIKNAKDNDILSYNRYTYYINITDELLNKIKSINIKYNNNYIYISHFIFPNMKNAMDFISIFNKYNKCVVTQLYVDNTNIDKEIYNYILQKKTKSLNINL